MNDGGSNAASVSDHAAEHPVEVSRAAIGPEKGPNRDFILAPRVRAISGRGRVGVGPSPYGGPHEFVMLYIGGRAVALHRR